ncbi:TRAP transporter small permease [Ornithinimicrobium cavernae]|uniref:TRAP transporter small permease n=1 Tax=Ornithinimicrobium cavernae TaxID=2666047 RepID=UPI000D687804|nr:TRAP transporter small permease subunit [Ornithinimicrobium cavernae]
MRQRLSATIDQIQRIREILATGIAWIAGMGLFAIFAVNVAQIFQRAFGGGWIWVSDFSRLMFVWVALLGGAAAYGLYDHITVTFVVERAPARLRTACAMVVRLTEIALCVILLIAGTAILSTRMGIDYVQLGVPTGIAYLAVPVFAGLVLLFALTGRLRATPSSPEVDPAVELAATEIETAQRRSREGGGA